MVAMNVWPTDGAAGSVATEARWRSMGRAWTGSGVITGVGLELAPTLAMPNLTVKAGACWVDGHYCELTSDQVLTATANGLAVVRFDPAANTADLLWRDAVSTPAQSPTGTWELPIAKTVGSVLTDLRARYTEVGRFPNATARTVGMPTPALNALTMLDNRPGVPQYWNGTAWTDAVPFVQAFSASPTPSAGGDAVVTFPVAFATAPVVTCTSSAAAYPTLVVTVINATNCTIRIIGNTGTAIGMQIMAVGNRVAAT